MTAYLIVRTEVADADRDAFVTWSPVGRQGRF